MTGTQRFYFTDHLCKSVSEKTEVKVSTTNSRSDVERPGYEMQGPPGLWSPRRGLPTS